ncbi:MAG: PH domain-containing protein [Bacillota bacterium]|nr:PH domain-containing protein [Bacillota bacterium]
MERFSSVKGNAYKYILLITVLCNAFFVFISFFINSYIAAIFIRIFLVVFNLYQLYYLLLSIFVEYQVSNDRLDIVALTGFKDVSLNLKDITMYSRISGNINGVRLSGYGRDSFALGNFVISKIGLVHMYVTSSRDMFYLKEKDETYAVSPEDAEKFENILIEKGVKKGEWEGVKIKSSQLYKDKRFMVPFFVVSFAIIALCLIPVVLYLRNVLPVKMPISFDTKFMPAKWGTGKQFAFQQMIYGAYNAGILFCMYYAAYFNAKYSRKLAYKYIYLSLIITVTFLFMQFKMLITFR